MYIVLLIPVI